MVIQCSLHLFCRPELVACEWQLSLSVLQTSWFLFLIFFLISCRRVIVSNPPSGTAVPEDPRLACHLYVQAWGSGLGCVFLYTDFWKYYRTEDIKLVVNKNNRWGKLDKNMYQAHLRVCWEWERQLDKRAVVCTPSGHGWSTQRRGKKPYLTAWEVQSKAVAIFLTSKMGLVFFFFQGIFGQFKVFESGTLESEGSCLRPCSVSVLRAQKGSECE